MSQQVDIDAHVDEVWAVLEDARLLPELSASTVEAIEPGRRLVIEGSVLPGTRYRMTEVLERVDESCTRLELTMEYRLPFGPLGRLAGRLGAERRAVAEAAEVVEGVRRVVSERSGTK